MGNVIQFNRIFTLTVIVLLVNKSFAQFCGAAGTVGSTAIYKDSSIIIDWASSSKITRGLQNISNPNAGFVSVGDSVSAIGKAGENGIVSLGDGGSAILTFTNPIKNGSGFDFAVFENSFQDYFLELALVEASSDGVNFFRFPATSNTDTATQISSFDLLDPTKLNNLAGKYRANYGTPFDIDELPDNLLLNKNYITHIKIIDVVGSMNNQYSSRDFFGKKINDPFPTEFPSGGFDLDAVGVIHNQSTTAINEDRLDQMWSIYPNPTNGDLFIKNDTNTSCEFTLINSLGAVVLVKTSYSINEKLSLDNLPRGIYMLQLKTDNELLTKKILKN